jgi:hypothetical protein
MTIVVPRVLLFLAGRSWSIREAADAVSLVTPAKSESFSFA